MKEIVEATRAGLKDPFATMLPSRGERCDSTSVKGAHFNQALLEFSRACEGCGETPYAKLLTELLGKLLIMADATGCSSIWGAILIAECVVDCVMMSEVTGGRAQRSVPMPESWSRVSFPT